MNCIVIILLARATVAAAADPQWSILQPEISAVTIGIGFKDDLTGWSSGADGSHLPGIIKTTDGGVTWHKVQNTTGVPLMIVTAVGVRRDPSVTDVTIFGAVADSKYSLDGEHFKQALRAPIAGQDAKYQGGRMLMAGPKAACVSSTGGAVFTCHYVPIKNEATGRYMSSPSKNVIFYTAGNWPRQQGETSGLMERPDGTSLFHVTSNLRVVQDPRGTQKLELGPVAQADDQNLTIYTAELWKSTDGGSTWKNLISEEGTYFFNDIDCFDDNNCVLIGEGSKSLGSKSPGARIWTTTDGENFKQVHVENTTGEESLMTAQMISATEHWVGGTQQLGANVPALLLHTKDGGATYTNENNGIVGQAITDVDFLSAKHGYATAITPSAVCSVLEYTAKPKHASVTPAFATAPAGLLV